MNKKQLLVVRLGTAQYGVLVDAVKGVIAGPMVNYFPITENAHKISQPQNSANMLRGNGARAPAGNNSILMYTDGVQVTMTVDEVVKVAEVDSKLQAELKRPAVFRIWRLR